MGVPPGQYLGLSYRGWAVASESVAFGLRRATPPNAIVFGVRNELSGGSNLITANYLDSKVARVDMIRMAYGCTINLQGAGVATSCTIRVTATRPNSAGTPSSVVSQLFRFQSPLLPTGPIPMAVADFSDDFKGVTDLRMEITNSVVPAGLDDTTLAMSVDNLSYKTYPKA